MDQSVSSRRHVAYWLVVGCWYLVLIGQNCSTSDMQTTTALYVTLKIMLSQPEPLWPTLLQVGVTGKWNFFSELRLFVIELSVINSQIISIAFIFNIIVWDKVGGGKTCKIKNIFLSAWLRKLSTENNPFYSSARRLSWYSGSSQKYLCLAPQVLTMKEFALPRMLLTQKNLNLPSVQRASTSGYDNLAYDTLRKKTTPSTAAQTYGSCDLAFCSSSCELRKITNLFEPFVVVLSVCHPPAALFDVLLPVVERWVVQLLYPLFPVWTFSVNLCFISKERRVEEVCGWQVLSEFHTSSRCSKQSLSW